MKKIFVCISIVALISGTLWLSAAEKPDKNAAPAQADIVLPAAKVTGTMTLEEAVGKRQSIRAYKPDVLSQEQLSQILWSAQGLSPRQLVPPSGTNRGKQFMSRNCPSAGGIFPMDVYVVDSNNVYLYQPQNHSLKTVKTTSGRDIKSNLCTTAYGQASIKDAAIALVITGDIAKCAKRYGDRAPRYVAMEAGHIGQNVALQAVALGLGTVMIGAFDDEKVSEVLGLPDNQSPMYIIPIGYPKE